VGGAVFEKGDPQMGVKSKLPIFAVHNRMKFFICHELIDLREFWVTWFLDGTVWCFRDGL